MSNDQKKKMQKQNAPAAASGKGGPAGVGENLKGKHGRELAHDDRFKHAQRDPRFQRLPEKKSQVAVDSRFKGMFTNPMFSEEHTVDKRGRALGKAGAGGADLKKLYRVEDGEKDGDNDDGEKDGSGDSSSGGDDDDSDGSSSSSSSSSDNDKAKQKKKKTEEEKVVAPPKSDRRARQEYLTKLARGEISGESSSSDDDDDLEGIHIAGDSDDDDDDDNDEDDEDVPTGDATRRIAVMDLAWEHVRAVDVLAALQSFVPSHADAGHIIDVTVCVSLID
jgi:hypothetical protein